MTEAECPNFARGDKKFILTSTTRWSADKDRKEDLYAALKDKGYEHLFTVNSQTLGGFIKDLAEEFAADNDGEEGLPDWIIGLVKSYDDVGVTMRKAK
jgi:hypothetical protein